MKKLVFVFLVSLALACSSAKHGSASSGSQQTPSGSSLEGSTYENAIVIKEKSEATGVSAEYKWIREHYPGSKTSTQALDHMKGKSYDVITITTAGGVEKKIYFDISNFFGKF